MATFVVVVVVFFKIHREGSIFQISCYLNFSHTAKPRSLRNGWLNILLHPLYLFQPFKEFFLCFLNTPRSHVSSAKTDPLITAACIKALYKYMNTFVLFDKPTCLDVLMLFLDVLTSICLTKVTLS